MKKLFAFIGVTLGIAVIPFILNNKITYVKAEEEVAETEPEPIIEEEPAETEDDDSKFEEFKNYVSEKLDNIVGEDLAAKIVTWLLDSGVLIAAFTGWIKASKYKGKTVEDFVKEFKSQIDGQIADEIKKLSENDIKKINDSINAAEETLNAMIKALALAQSKTADSKVAMLDLIARVNESDKVQNCIEEIKTEIVKEQVKEEKAKESVKEDYIPID